MGLTQEQKKRAVRALIGGLVYLAIVPIFLSIFIKLGFINKYTIFASLLFGIAGNQIIAKDFFMWRFNSVISKKTNLYLIIGLIIVGLILVYIGYRLGE